MKIIKEKLITPCVLLGAFLILVTGNDVVGKNLTNVEHDMATVVLESVEAEFHPANRVVTVKGSIRNVSNSFVRGFLSLHLLSKNGTVLQTFEVPLKEHQVFAQGESVSFDTVLNTPRVHGASQVSIDFTKE